MLKKENRLTTKEFLDVFKKGEKKHNSFFLLVYTKNDKKVKVGVSIPKKIFKKAVDRNKTKRIIFNLLKKNHLLPKKGYFVFVLKKPTQNEEEIFNNIKNILIKFK